MSEQRPATAPAPAGRPGQSYMILGVLCVLAGLAVGFLAPVLWSAAAAGLFVGGCVLVVGSRLVDAAARREAIAAHANVLLAYIAERESQRS